MPRDLDDVRDSLKEIKETLRHFDDKWESQIQQTAADRQKLYQLCKQVHTIEQVLTRGNGRASLMVQLSNLEKDISQLKEDHKALKEVSGLEPEATPEQAKLAASKARWTAIAKFVALAVAISPGILALLGVGG